MRGILSERLLSGYYGLTADSNGDVMAIIDSYISEILNLHVIIYQVEGGCGFDTEHIFPDPAPIWTTQGFGTSMLTTLIHTHICAHILLSRHTISGLDGQVS